MKRAMLTVIGKDRPGIIAGVTRILYQRKCNLEDVSMTILEGEFAMILIVCLAASAEKAVQKDLSQWAKKARYTFFWKELKERLRRGEKHREGCDTYLVSVMGRDQMGIVYKTSQVLAKHGLNITDLNSKILGQGAKTIYTMLLEVDVPRRFPVVKLNRELSTLGKKLRLEFRLKPVERIEF